MTPNTIELIHVFYHGTGKKLPVGRLLLKQRQIYFEYHAEFLKYDLALSPFKLPLQRGVIASEDNTFEGLFGVFNDSLPDGWGRLLLDRKLMSLNINPRKLTPLDRLSLIGSNGMGALSYEPETDQSFQMITDDLDEIETEIQATLSDDNRFIENLLQLGGSSGGARPKVLINLDHTHWLIKFRSSLDPKDMSAIEFAYHLMAKEAGLDLSEAKLFPAKHGVGYFGVKRFDRYLKNKIHTHTLAGLIHADHHEPSVDYETIMKVTLHLTHDIRECKIQFRNAVFNVLSHNRDDHAKNFSFLMDETGKWRVSPAYDLTFSSGPFGEHATTIMGEGKNPSQAHLLQLAKKSDIEKQEALNIIAEVMDAIKKWQKIAANAGVSKQQTALIQKTLTQISSPPFF